jgi:hypothetical protein
MTEHKLSQAHIRQSVVGEEDPGASMDVVQALLEQKRRVAQRSPAQGPAPGAPGAPSTTNPPNAPDAPDGPHPPSAPDASDAPQQAIHIDLTQGTQAIAADVAWAPARHKSTADLLGLVVAHHGHIADTAWLLFQRTGQRSVALEVDEDRDGVFYVSRRDC